MKRLSKVICAGLGFVLVGAVGANAAGWSVKSGKSDGNLGYVQGVSKSGKAAFWVTCYQDSPDVVINLIDLPMPSSTRVNNAKSRFYLVFELGAGVRSTVNVDARYAKNGRSWSADVYMDKADREAFGAAQKMYVVRSDRKIAASFLAQGSRNMQKLMQRMCFDNPKRPDY